MDQRSDYLRQDIESTRAALDTKLDTLETKARETFDLKHQVAERPWMALGAAVLAGYVLGSMGGDGEQQRWHGQPMMTNDYNQHAMRSNQYNQSNGEGFLSQFDDEINMLKTAAITTLTSFLRESVREYLPGMGDELERVARERGHTSSSASYGAGHTGSSTSGYTGSSTSGYTSPTTTSSYGSSSLGHGSDTNQATYPTTSNRDYVKTYHPPSETESERAIGGEPNRS